MKFSSKAEYKNHVIGMMKELKEDYFSNEEIVDLSKSIENYSNNDYGKIKFEWNTKHAEEFNDSNLKFREKIAVYACLNSDKVKSPELWRDLFIEEAKASKEKWGVNEFLFIIGEHLLKLGKGQYIKEFCIGLSMSFDTYGCCSSIDLSGVKIKDLINSIELEIENTSDRDVLRALEFGKEFVENNCA